MATARTAASATANSAAVQLANLTASATSTSAVVLEVDSPLHLDLVLEEIASAAVLVLVALVVVVILAKQVEVTLAQQVVATEQALLEPMEATSHHFEKQQTR